MIRIGPRPAPPLAPAPDPVLVVAAHGCRDCGAGPDTTCDEACPTYAALEADWLYEALDAHDDYVANTYPHERGWVA